LARSDQGSHNEDFDSVRYTNIDVDVDFGKTPLASAVHIYSPLLSTKRAERNALGGVCATDRGVVAPLILVRPIPKKGAQYKDAAGKTQYGPPPPYKSHLNEQALRLIDICTDAMGLFGKFERLFVEVEALQEQRKSNSVLDDMMHVLGANCADFVPVTDPYRSPRHQNAVKAWHATNKTGVAIRLRECDSWPPVAVLDGLMTQFCCRHEDADIFLDIGSVFNGALVPLVNPLLTAISSYRSRRWRRICLVSGAFPDTIKAFPWTKTPVVRKDLALYLAISAKLQARGSDPVFFGDYASVHTEVTDGGGPIDIPPNIRYTDSEFWFVYRREAKRQMQDLCRAIVADFPDVPFRKNRGDEWISEQSNGNLGPENPEAWVQVGLSHHIWFVVRQMNGLP
jgi:hypothetical protein